MRTLTLGLVGLVIVLAATVAIGKSLDPFHLPVFLSTLILALATAIQRIGTVQRFVSGADPKRDTEVQRFAQGALTACVRGQRVRVETLTLVVHVWEVPLWYRRAFPYSFRNHLKSLVRRLGLSRLIQYSLKPTLNRVAAVGLKKPTPSGIPFTKDVGLIGVCLAANDPTTVFTLDIASPEYAAALKMSAADWDTLDAKLTNAIGLEQAQQLARKYGQVLARVVQDPETGEPVGCVTISVAQTTVRELQLLDRPCYKDELTTLADTVGSLLRI